MQVDDKTDGYESQWIDETKDLTRNFMATLKVDSHGCNFEVWLLNNETIFNIYKRTSIYEIIVSACYISIGRYTPLHMSRPGLKGSPEVNVRVV
jgi:hypothetical protein